MVKNAELTTSGPYAHLRHPLYLGTILVSTGFAIWLGGGVAMVVLAVVWPWFSFHYFPRKERSEADRLEARYGERFVRYRRAVPALRPRLEAWHDDEGSAGKRTHWRLARYSENNELGTLLAICLGVIVFWLRSGSGTA
ncbi:MAG TPA: isoprenylcysteine carboxylmethyltransferase family protein [Deltaproteobacteria bacterium]|nr:isoprenylcysteine carboxylmethyltransferase family protein [Deltaproteobacteria bacterium]